MKINILIVICFLVIIFLGWVLWHYNYSSLSSNPLNNNPTFTSTSTPPRIFTEPINNALSRVTKKPFGLYVSPNQSPISPERFTGYHTGIDFETTSTEADIAVPIYAVCNGVLLQKETTTGYGGVAVQSCMLNGQPITVIYGHIKLSSVSAAVGQPLLSGQPIAILGAGYSPETDGERKHLHLGIHKGSAINILGYVQSQTDLSSWIDIVPYLTSEK